MYQHRHLVTLLYNLHQEKKASLESYIVIFLDLGEILDNLGMSALFYVLTLLKKSPITQIRDVLVNAGPVLIED